MPLHDYAALLFHLHKSNAISHHGRHDCKQPLAWCSDAAGHS
ncbi:uncharacterized protein DNG_05654 [Cephalotrichum gorgonifer]|uniref:Uncharacterized protein n=1 Tax=Cephalotrichum gorgonifer TaxID=2041049 RepID=A0AAE8N085_9PEZI|nr:uncharacterized protein DNG_05654 [Cephalotrichum gorgonifer]